MKIKAILDEVNKVLEPAIQSRCGYAFMTGVVSEYLSSSCNLWIRLLIMSAASILVFALCGIEIISVKTTNLVIDESDPEKGSHE